MSQYRYPAADLIGKTIELNTGKPVAGSVWFIDRQPGYRTRIIDAGNMTNVGHCHIICEDGNHFWTGDYSDYRIID